MYKSSDLVADKVPAMVSWVSTLRAAVSVPDVGGALPGVNHDRAEGHADQPAPGGVMDVCPLPRSGCQLSKVYLQHPQVPVAEKEKQREAGPFSPGEDVGEEGVGVCARGVGGRGQEVGGKTTPDSLALLQLPGVDQGAREELWSDGGRRVGLISCSLKIKEAD